MGCQYWVHLKCLGFVLAMKGGDEEEALNLVKYFCPKHIEKNVYIFKHCNFVPFALRFVKV